MLIHVRQIACWEDETEFDDVNELARKVVILDPNDPKAIQITGGCTARQQQTAATAAGSAGSSAAAVPTAPAGEIISIDVEDGLGDLDIADLPLDDDDGLEAIDEGLYLAHDVALVDGVPDFDALESPSSPPEKKSDPIRRFSCF